VATVAVVLPRHIGEQEDPVFARFVELVQGVGGLYHAAALADDPRYGAGDLSALARSHSHDGYRSATGIAGQ
jgi:hypothetical protein